jgi:hypothetical protein
MNKLQTEARMLIVLEATKLAVVWSGTSSAEIAKTLRSMDHGEISERDLDRLLTTARKAGLLEFAAIFGWRCWNLTSTGRAALAAGHVDLP